MKTIRVQVSEEDYIFLKNVAKENGNSIPQEIRHVLKVYYALDTEPQEVLPVNRRHPRIGRDGYYNPTSEVK
jgi:hypothetical protein